MPVLGTRESTGLPECLFNIPAASGVQQTCTHIHIPHTYTMHTCIYTYMLLLLCLIISHFSTDSVLSGSLYEPIKKVFHLPLPRCLRIAMPSRPSFPRMWERGKGTEGLVWICPTSKALCSCLLKPLPKDHWNIPFAKLPHYLRMGSFLP